MLWILLLLVILFTMTLRVVLPLGSNKFYVLGRTTKLPAFFVFGKALISVSDCVNNLMDHAINSGKPILVLFGLEYAHLVQNIREEVVKAYGSRPQLEIQFAEILCSDMNPSEHQNISNKGIVSAGVLTEEKSFGIVAGNRRD